MVLLDLPDSRDYFESMLVDAGVQPRIQYRSASYETVRGMVARGHGFSILNQEPAHHGTYDGGEVVAVPIRGDAPGLPIVIARAHVVRATAGRAPSKTLPARSSPRTGSLTASPLHMRFVGYLCFTDER